MRTGEHFYTRSYNEYNNLTQANNTNWRGEGFAWYSYEREIDYSYPVYRVYNPKSGFHHFTRSINEKNNLVNNAGWKYEGIAWYSADDSGIPLNRFYNPRTGDHFYTQSVNETNSLKKPGSEWKFEGIAFYGVR